MTHRFIFNLSSCHVTVSNFYLIKVKIKILLTKNVRKKRAKNNITLWVMRAFTFHKLVVCLLCVFSVPNVLVKIVSKYQKKEGAASSFTPFGTIWPS